MKKTEENVRVRLAPSPTGLLHVGTARIALVNWLFAKQHKGSFIIRIEDTDKERSKKEYEKNILEGLQWLGLNWDEGPDMENQYGPYRQSERTKYYKQYLIKLLEEGKAYYCFCTKEELEAERTAMLAEGIAPRYRGHCRNLTHGEAQQRLKSGRASVIRFKTPETKIAFHDIVRGTVEFDMALVGDMVIAKDTETPLYNFAVTIDDHEMAITHVIRGEDHIANTPKQIVIQHALGLATPHYAHLPLILAPNRSKLSKRDLETSVDDYRTQGYLPEAICNFIALMGWHPKDDRELFTLQELIQEFDLRRVQKAGAVFAVEKLDWLNAQYIKKLSIEELTKKILPHIPESWRAQKALLMNVVALEQERIKKLNELQTLAGFFFDLPKYDVALLAWPRGTALNAAKTTARLNAVATRLEKMTEQNFTKQKIEEEITSLAEQEGKGEILWPLRATLSGLPASPGPFEIMEVLGKAESLRRIQIAINAIQEKLTNE